MPLVKPALPKLVITLILVAGLVIAFRSLGVTPGNILPKVLTSDKEAKLEICVLAYVLSLEKLNTIEFIYFNWLILFKLHKL